MPTRDGLPRLTHPDSRESGGRRRAECPLVFRTSDNSRSDRRLERPAERVTIVGYRPDSCPREQGTNIVPARFEQCCSLSPHSNDTIMLLGQLLCLAQLIDAKAISLPLIR